MRGRLLSLFVVLCCSALVAPASAKGGGVSLVAPGDEWDYQSDVPLGSVRIAVDAEKVPHFAYLIRRGHSTMPPILGGRVELTHIFPDDAYLRFETHFRIPDVEAGRYHVVLCRRDCASPLGTIAIPIHVMGRTERRLVRKLQALRAEFNGQNRALEYDREKDAELAAIRQRVNSKRVTDLRDRVTVLEEKLARSSPGTSSASVFGLGLAFAAGTVVTGLVRKRRRNSLQDR